LGKPLTARALPAQPVDGSIAGDGEQPRRRRVGRSRRRPALECDREGVLQGVLGQLEVAEAANQRSENPGSLLTEDLLDETVPIQRCSLLYGRGTYGRSHHEVDEPPRRESTPGRPAEGRESRARPMG
jgi:hypothetical protein